MVNASYYYAVAPPAFAALASLVLRISDGPLIKEATEFAGDWKYAQDLPAAEQDSQRRNLRDVILHTANGWQTRVDMFNTVV